MYQHLKVMSQWIQDLTNLDSPPDDDTIYVAHFADKALKVSTITGVKDEDFIGKWDKNTNQYKPGEASTSRTRTSLLASRAPSKSKAAAAAAA